MEATAFDPAAAIDAGPLALALAADAGLEDVRIDVTISVALARGHRGEHEALSDLLDAKAAAKRAGLTIPTVRTYVNLAFVGSLLREHALVDAIADEAHALFEDHHTTIPGWAVEIYRARSLLDRGRWDEARAMAARKDRDWISETPVARALEGIVGARRGEPSAAQLLDRAWEEISVVPESSRHMTIRMALIEAVWLAGDRAGAVERIGEARESIAAGRFARLEGELALWASRLGVELPAPAGAPAPVVLELEGDWRGAIRAWRELEAPYDAALAAIPGDDRAAGEALATLHRLGATAASRAFARERSERGAPTPRGPRRSTLEHPAGMTAREQEVLEQLATGATNAAIAGRLHVSERTIAHHVSAILSKLDAPTRTAAIEHARRRGLLDAR